MHQRMAPRAASAPRPRTTVEFTTTHRFGWRSTLRRPFRRTSTAAGPAGRSAPGAAPITRFHRSGRSAWRQQGHVVARASGASSLPVPRRNGPRDHTVPATAQHLTRREVTMRLYGRGRCHAPGLVARTCRRVCAPSPTAMSSCGSRIVGDERQSRGPGRGGVPRVMPASLERDRVLEGGPPRPLQIAHRRRLTSASTDPQLDVDRPDDLYAT
jgi:hypothetical protein